MKLAMFDLDNTLLNGDSDFLWGQFLVKQDLVDAQHYEAKNQQFYDDYKDGTLDIFAFLEFSLEPLARLPQEQLLTLQKQYIESCIKPLISDKALALVEQHRQLGHTLMIITATNSFITAPIAKLFSVDNLLATEPEILEQTYTGKVSGTPCFKDGKVTRLNQWLQQQSEEITESWFYSDSHNDLPLLEFATHSFAVNPDDELKGIAEKSNWPILNIHDD